MPTYSVYTTSANINQYQSEPVEHYPIFYIYKKQFPGENDVLFTRTNKGEYKYCYFSNHPLLSTYGLNQPPNQYTNHKADSYALIRLLEYPAMCEILPKIFIRDLLIFLAR